MRSVMFQHNATTQCVAFSNVRAVFPVATTVLQIWYIDVCWICVYTSQTNYQ